jgi:LPXTG-motif cell wall-anchored protein
MKALKFGALAFLACAIAGYAVAQNADQNTGGPTANDYRLRVIEPAAGATITGDELQITVDTEIPAERGDIRRDTSSMPHPNVDVFVDDAFQQTIKGESGENVVHVRGLAPGPHKIVLLAKNRSGEVIDRKVINVSLVAPPVAKAPVVEAPAPPPPPPAPAYVPPPAPPAPPPAPPVQELPKTGSDAPLLAVAGLALLLGGLAIRRFV